MKILMLTRYGRSGASSRLRAFQYVDWLERSGFHCVIRPLFGDEMLARKYQHGGYKLADVVRSYVSRISSLIRRREFDVVWIEKEALPWLPAWFEKRLLDGIPYVMDFDDAIFHNYDLHKNRLVRRIYGSRIDRLMAQASLVMGGNLYLANRAIQAGASHVKIVPTVIDASRYVPRAGYASDSCVRVVWIGSPSTAQYLKLIAKPLKELSAEIPFVFRVIGASDVDLPGVDVELCEWQENTEATLVAECDVGVMPLLDSPWEQGKCAYKLIQYMACGLPTIASPVGANRDVILEGVTGLFASTDAEWMAALRTLLKSGDLREQMGRAGRSRVESSYSLEKTASEVGGLFKTFASCTCAE